MNHAVLPGGRLGRAGWERRAERAGLSTTERAGLSTTVCSRGESSRTETPPCAAGCAAALPTLLPAVVAAGALIDGEKQTESGLTFSSHLRVPGCGEQRTIPAAVSGSCVLETLGRNLARKKDAPEELGCDGEGYSAECIPASVTGLLGRHAGAKGV